LVGANRFHICWPTARGLSQSKQNFCIPLSQALLAKEKKKKGKNKTHLSIYLSIQLSSETKTKTESTQMTSR